jgi:hypothetical protein
VANQAAWQAGWQTGSHLAAEARARKQALSDEERQLAVSTLYERGHSLSRLIPSLTGPDRDKAMSQLTDIEASIKQVYHPDRNPGALQKDWHFLTGLIRKPRPAAAALSTTTEAGTPEQALSMPGPSVSFPGSTINVVRPPASGIGPSQSFKAVTPSTTVTPEQSITLSATPATKTATVKPAALTSSQRQRMSQREQARAAAEQDARAAGLTPEETAQADAAQKLAYVRQSVRDYESINPNATSQEKAAFLSDLVEKTYGIAAKPVWKEYAGPDGQREWLDASKPELIPPGWSATGTESADTRKRADYAAYVKTHPDYESEGGTYEQWLTERSQLAKRAVPTSKDDRFIDIERRRALGQPLTKDDQAYADAYDIYVKKRITGPMLARVAAQAADRYVPFMDPANPDRVIMMPVAEGARAGLGTPQSIAFQTDKAMQKYMTSGKGGENIGYFNTAVNHLELLEKVGDALNNGDLPAVNRIGNILATETGEEAPTDFNAVKNAVAGEVAKVFTGRGATVEEITAINQTINNAQSPEQILGAIRYYKDLMGGKLGAMRSQWDAAKRGTPAFPPTKMKAPDGTIMEVPFDQVEHYKSRGAVVVVE